MIRFLRMELVGMALDSIIEASLLALRSEGNNLLRNIILEQLCEAKWLKHNTHILVDSMILI